MEMGRGEWERILMEISFFVMGKVGKCWLLIFFCGGILDDFNLRVMIANFRNCFGCLDKLW